MKTFLSILILLSFAQPSFGKMDPSRPHLTPANCWGNCIEDTTDQLNCTYTPPGLCRAYTFDCVGGYQLKFKVHVIKDFFLSNEYNAKEVCESHLDSVKKTLSLVD